MSAAWAGMAERLDPAHTHLENLREPYQQAAQDSGTNVWVWRFWPSIGSGMPSVDSACRSGHTPASSEGRERRRSTLSLRPCLKTTMPSGRGICLAVAAAASSFF